MINWALLSGFAIKEIRSFNCLHRIFRMLLIMHQLLRSACIFMSFYYIGMAMAFLSLPGKTQCFR